MLIIFGVMIVRSWLIFSETEIAATAAAATTIATGYYTANDETGLDKLKRKEKNDLKSLVHASKLAAYRITLHAGDVTTKYAFTFSSPNCSAMYNPNEP